MSAETDKIEQLLATVGGDNLPDPEQWSTALGELFGIILERLDGIESTIERHYEAHDRRSELLEAITERLDAIEATIRSEIEYRDFQNERRQHETRALRRKVGGNW